MPAAPAADHPVLDTADGPVRLLWLEESPHPSDVYSIARGWSVHMVQALHDECQIGHLRVAYVTDEDCRRVAPTGLHFMAQFRGWCLNFDDPVDLWIAAHLHASRTPISLRGSAALSPSWGLTRALAPAPPLLEQDLAALAAAYEPERESWLAHVTTPDVAFAYVDDGERTGSDWRRRGVAREMYRLAARVLGERGLVLRASTLQSDAAQAMWASFEADPTMPTVRRGDVVQLDDRGPRSRIRP